MFFLKEKTNVKEVVRSMANVKEVVTMCHCVSPYVIMRDHASSPCMKAALYVKKA